MPVRPLPRSVSCTTQVRRTRLVRCTMAPQPWTGWCRSRSVVSPSPLPLPPATGSGTGRSIRSTSSTPRDTSTSPLRWSVRSAFSMVPSLPTLPLTVCSPSRRLCGARPTSTTCPVSATSTRWTVRVLTSSRPSARWSMSSVLTPSPSRFLSALRRTSRVLSTSSR